MLVPFEQTNRFDSDPHHFRIYETIYSDNSNWLEPLAKEYIKILTYRETPLKIGNFSEDTIMDMSRLQKYVKKASIPKYKTGNFNVVRSDFGELLCYMLLERDYNTLFGAKSIYHRELKDVPGRGIDAIGVENNDKLTLVLCEVKVSDEQPSPPRVVDRNEDCLSKQHIYHLENLYEETKYKVWRVANKTRNEQISDLLTAAAICLEEKRLDKLRIVACSVLVRPKTKYRQSDFGSFKTQTDQFHPAIIRFLIACIPDDIDDIIKQWYDVIQDLEVSV